MLTVVAQCWATLPPHASRRTPPAPRLPPHAFRSRRRSDLSANSYGSSCSSSATKPCRADRTLIEPASAEAQRLAKEGAGVELHGWRRPAQLGLPASEERDAYRPPEPREARPAFHRRLLSSGPLPIDGVHPRWRAGEQEESAPALAPDAPWPERGRAAEGTLRKRLGIQQGELRAGFVASAPGPISVELRTARHRPAPRPSGRRAPP